MALTDAQIKAYYASEGNKPNPLSPGAWLAQQGTSLNTAAPSSPGALSQFANSLNEAVRFAARKRDALSLGIMMPSQGTAPASDFSSIVSRLNSASDTTSTDLIKTANDTFKDAQPTYKTEQIGDTLYQYQVDGNGQIIGTPQAILKNTSLGGGVETHSGTLQYTKQDYSEDSRALEQSRGEDGWVDPAIYKQLYDAWISHGGAAKDFISKFPPSTYINPANKTLPPILRNPAKTNAIDFSTLPSEGE